LRSGIIISPTLLTDPILLAVGFKLPIVNILPVLSLTVIPIHPIDSDLPISITGGVRLLSYSSSVLIADCLVSGNPQLISSSITNNRINRFIFYSSSTTSSIGSLVSDLHWDLSLLINAS